MARTLTNAGLILSPHGLVVIHPHTLIVEAELPGLFPHLATMERAQRLHVASPHCTVVKDHDEGADLFFIEACRACAARARQRRGGRSISGGTIAAPDRSTPPR